jgi:hypothetical protein
MNSRSRRKNNRKRKESSNVRKLIVLKKYRQYLVWLLKKVHNFPVKQECFLKGEICSRAFDILKILSLMQRSPHYERGKLLIIFNSKLENLRQLLRIAWELKFISHKSFIWQETKIDEVGRMVYGLASFPSRSQ